MTVRSVTDLDPSADVPLSPDGLLRVWCLSQILIRDDQLTPDPTPEGLARLLSDRLGAGDGGLTVVRHGADGTAPTSVRVSRRESSQARWGRPRPSLVGLAAGSVVSLRVAGGMRLDQAMLADVERTGIGERTAEGFGAVRFNPPELTGPAPALDDSGEMTVAAASADDNLEVAVHDGGRSLAIVEVAAWRAAIGRSVAVHAAHPDRILRNISKVTSRAQRAALLQQAERLGLADGRPMAEAWFTATRKVARRARAWHADQDATPSALDDAHTLLLGDPGRVWQVLSLDGPQPGLVTAAGREDVVRGELWQEAVTALISAVLRSVRQQEASHGA